MGPQASAAMVQLMVKLATDRFGAGKRESFPEIILDSIPVPDFISNEKSKKKLIRMLSQRVKKLDKFKPLCFSFACNTVHLFIDDLKSKSKTKFISMIDEVVSSVKKQNITKVGLLASPLTLKTTLYQNRFNLKKIKVITPRKDEIKVIEKVIRNVIKGETNNSDSFELVDISNSLIKKGAEAIILGCTELPLVFPIKFEFPVFNSLEILALKLLNTYYKFDNID